MSRKEDVKVRSVAECIVKALVTKTSVPLKLGRRRAAAQNRVQLINCLSLVFRPGLIDD